MEWKKAISQTKEIISKSYELQTRGTNVEEVIQNYLSLIQSTNPAVVNSFTSEHKVFVYYQLGKIHYEKGLYEESLRYFSLCSPSFYSTYYQAIINHKLNQLTEAINFYAQFLALQSSQTSSIFLDWLISDENERLEVESKFDSKNLSFVHFNYSLALLSFPPSTDIINEAVQQLHNTLTLYPKHSHARLVLGGLYMKEMNWQKAKEVLEPQLRYEPNNYVLLYNYALINQQLANPNHNNNQTRPQNINDDNDDEGGNEQQRQQQRIHHLNVSIEVYQRVITLNPTFAAAQCNLAEAIRLKGEVNQSLPYYRKALELISDPDLPIRDDSSSHRSIYYYNLGLSQLQTHQHHNAISSFKKFISLYSPPPPPLTSDDNNDGGVGGVGGVGGGVGGGGDASIHHYHQLGEEERRMISLAYDHISDCMIKIAEKLKQQMMITEAEVDFYYEEAYSHLSIAFSLFPSPSYSQKLTSLQSSSSSLRSYPPSSSSSSS